MIFSEREREIQGNVVQENAKMNQFRETTSEETWQTLVPPLASTPHNGRVSVH